MSGLTGADYKKLLTDNIRDREVAAVADSVMKSGDPIELVRHILTEAGGGGSIGGLDQDGLNKAFFELKLIDVGARLTYERIQHQGRYNYPASVARLHRTSLKELKQLVQCVKAVGWSSGSIRRVLNNAIDKTGCEGTKLSDLDWIGRDLIYRDLITVLVNERAHL